MDLKSELAFIKKEISDETDEAKLLRNDNEGSCENKPEISMDEQIFSIKKDPEIEIYDVPEIEFNRFLSPSENTGNPALRIDQLRQEIQDAKDDLLRKQRRRGAAERKLKAANLDVRQAEEKVLRLETERDVCIQLIRQQEALHRAIEARGLLFCETCKMLYDWQNEYHQH